MNYPIDETPMRIIGEGYYDVLKAQSKETFLNERYDSIAEWVLFEHLDLFCEENGYEEWKKQKQETLEKSLVEEL